MILLFCPSIFPVVSLLCRNSAVFEDLNYFQHFPMLFCAHLLQRAAVHQFWSHSLSRITRALPAPNQNFSLSVYSSNQIVTSRVTFPIFQKNWTSMLVLCISLASSYTYCLFHISYTDSCWPQHTTPFDASFPHSFCQRISIFIYSLPLPHHIHRYFSASPHHSVRCFVSSSFTKIHFSSGFGMSSSQSFHSSARQ